MRRLGRLVRSIGWLAGTLALWRVLFWLVVERNVGAIADFWAPERLLAYAVFIAAPAATFWPLSRWVRVPFLTIEATIGWSTTGYVVTFVDPSRVHGALAMLIVLLPLLVAVSSLFTVAAAWITQRVASRRGGQMDPLRARRRGYVLGFFTVGCLLLQSLDALTFLNVGLLALIAVFVELLAMTWFAPVRTTREDSDGSPGNRRGWDEYGRSASRPD